MLQLILLSILIYFLWLGRIYLPVLWKIFTYNNYNEYSEWKRAYYKKNGITMPSPKTCGIVVAEYNLDKGTCEEMIDVLDSNKE